MLLYYSQPFNGILITITKNPDINISWFSLKLMILY